MSGNLFIIAAPSGAGKTSLVKALVASSPTLKVSVSHTTRARRQGEVDGGDYYFVGKEEFLDIQRANGFLESATVFDHCYGTSRQFVEDMLANGSDVVLEIDWQGARQVKQNQPSAIGIFVLPPSLPVLEQRLRARGKDDEAVIARRMRDARNEIAHCPEFDYIVMNDCFETALADIQAIVRSCGLRRDHQLPRYAALFGLPQPDLL